MSGNLGMLGFRYASTQPTADLKANQINKASIHFEGPYTFTEGDRCLFTSDYAKSEGIYLWTFRQKQDDSYLIHYIGETGGFAKRQAEHLVFILGLYYGIFDPDEAAEGRCVRVF
jgi:hypothetical protein